MARRVGVCRGLSSRPAQQRGRGDAGPVQSVPHLPEPHPRVGAAADRGCCGGPIASARSRSAAGSTCRPRPSTLSWSAVGSTSFPGSTGSPVSRHEHDGPGSTVSHRRDQVRQRSRQRRAPLRGTRTGPSEPVRHAGPAPRSRPQAAARGASSIDHEASNAWIRTGVGWRPDGRGWLTGSVRILIATLPEWAMAPALDHVIPQPERYRHTEELLVRFDRHPLTRTRRLPQ